MAKTFKYGENGIWATKEGSSMAYNDQNGNFKPMPFAVTRASSATRVNKEGLIEVVGNDKLRIDYTDSSNGVALLEPSRTNLITYSEDFSQWSTVDGAVVTDNFTTSPDGTQNAAKVVYDGTSLGRIEISTGASGTNTQSIYLKTVSGTQVVSIGASSSDLTEVTVTSEWKRFTHTGSGSYPRVLCNDAATIYAWGAQLETGSYPTSYIPTTSGSTYEREADVANGAGNAQVFNDSEGVLFANIASQEADDNYIALSDGGTSNRLIFGYDNNAFYAYKNGTNVFYTTSTPYNVRSFFNKIALKYSNNQGTVIYANGFLINTGSDNLTTSGLNEVAFDSGSGVQDFYGKAKEVGYYDTALTDAELEALTSYTSFTNMANELNLTIK